MSSNEAYALQDVSQEIHVHYMKDAREPQWLPRVCRCRTYRRPAGSPAIHRTKDKKVFYSGLQTCGSVWACPVCAGRIAQGRAEEIQLANEIYLERNPGGSIVMGTFTVPHKRQEDFKSVLERLKTGWSRMKKAKSRARRTWEDLGIDFYITGLDPVYGQLNGWHPHLHVLLYFRSTPDLDDIREVLAHEWVRYAGKGLSKKQRDDMFLHGVTLSSVKTWNDYLTKLSNKKATDEEIKSCREAFDSSWQVPHEIALAHMKKGKKSSLSPFDMLRVLDTLDPYTPDYEKIRSFWMSKFYEYAEAIKGSRYVYFSRGFKRWLGLAEKTDEQIAEEQEAKDMDNIEYTAVIPPKDWQEILSNQWRGPLLRKIEQGLNYEEAMRELRASVFLPRKKPQHKKRRLAA